MQKKRLILSSLFLVLTLAFIGVGSNTAYAGSDDPQGGTEKKGAPPPPPPSSAMEAILAILGSLWW